MHYLWIESLIMDNPHNVYTMEYRDMVWRYSTHADAGSIYAFFAML